MYRVRAPGEAAGLAVAANERREAEEAPIPLRLVPTENPIQPSDACTYKNYPLILLIGIRNSVFLVLLPLYDSLPFSPSPCTLLFCASIGTDGGNPRPSPATGNPQPHSQKALLTISRSAVLDRLIAILEWLALRSADRQTGDCHQMASPRVSALLALEIENRSTRPTADRCRNSRTYPQALTRESFMGHATDSIGYPAYTIDTFSLSITL